MRPALSQAAAKADVTDSSEGRMQASCFSPWTGQSQRHEILGYTLESENRMSIGEDIRRCLETVGLDW